MFFRFTSLFHSFPFSYFHTLYGPSFLSSLIFPHQNESFPDCIQSAEPSLFMKEGNQNIESAAAKGVESSQTCKTYSLFHLTIDIKAAAQQEGCSFCIQSFR